MNSKWTALRRIILAGAVTATTMGFSVAMAQDEMGGSLTRELPKFETVVKDMKETKGLFTLYSFDANDPARDPSRLLASIPRSLLGKDLMLAVSISRGSNMGFPAGTDLVKFELSGNRLLLVAPDISVKETRGKPVTDAVTATYTPRHLAAFPVLSRSPQGDILVDFGSFVTATAAQFVGVPQLNARQAVIRYPKIKSFPDNVLVDVDAILPSASGGSSIGIGFSFRRLPDLNGSDYRPRVLDERVGYFPTVRQDWNAPYQSRETTVRYINRWNLKKKDPSLEMSPPDKPIVFVIEKTVPLQWRRYVKEGIEQWNLAFEKIGISNAIVVQQQTDDNEFADIDPEDARYNFFRWIVTGRGFAMGPSRPDPRTGEILDADIVMDDSMVRYYLQDFSLLTGPEAFAQIYGPEWIEFWEQNPSFIPAGIELKDVQKLATEMRQTAALAAGTPGELMVDVPGRTGEPVLSHPRGLFNPTMCTYAYGMSKKMAMLSLVTAAQSKDGKIPERLIGEMIRNIVSHEVGHTLGLRHNFKASTWLSPDEIKAARDKGNVPLYASVMDYDALILFPGDRIELVKHITTPVIGPYDYWAIEYGYGPGSDADAAKIASRTNEPGLAYATDEDVRGMSSPDPFANRWDMSSDLVAWAENQAKLTDELLADFDTWAVKPDESNYFLRAAFLSLMSDKTRSLSFVARLVGGQEFNRNRAGDPGAKPPLVPVDAATQRRAIELLGKTIFSDQFLAVRPEIFNKLVPTRHWDFDRDPPARIDFPVHQAMLSLQNSTLSYLTSPTVLQRVYDAEPKSTDADKFTAAELLSSVRKVIIGDLKVTETATDAKPMISSIRRNLQRQYVANLLAIANSRPGQLVSPDLHGMVRFTLRDISYTIGEALKDGAKIDLASKAHLFETKSLIDRTLDADEINVNVSVPYMMYLRPTPAQAPVGE